jgi:O-methyltransferase
MISSQKIIFTMMNLALLEQTLGSFYSAPNLIGDTDSWIAHIKELQRESKAPRKPDLQTCDKIARLIYLRFLMGLLSGLTLQCKLDIPGKEFEHCAYPYRVGRLWPTYGVTMTGHARMEVLMWMVQQVVKQNLKGSFVEAGVWRGGMSIFAKASFHVFGLPNRPIYLCDSFEGLPLPRANSVRLGEKNYHSSRALSVGRDFVLSQFKVYGVPSQNVSAYKGYFVHSLPKLREDLIAKKETIAMLRMDGDMYDSTIDILYNLYDLVEVGGMVTIDDFKWGSGAKAHSIKKSQPSFGAKQAILDFRRLHGIEDYEHRIHDIDGIAAWFVKAREINVKRDNYQMALNKKMPMERMLVQKPLTEGEVFQLELKWSSYESEAYKLWLKEMKSKMSEPKRGQPYFRPGVVDTLGTEHLKQFTL